MARRRPDRLPAVLLLALVLLAPAGGAAADEPPAEGGGAAPAWRARARAAGLSAEQVAALAEERVLLSDQAEKQIFSAYIGNPSPFITADSLLNAYHVLFAESLARLEEAQARRLPAVLRRLLADLSAAAGDLRGSPELAAAARRRNRLVLGVALRLLEPGATLDDAELDRLVAAEAERVEAARGRALPAWLGAPGPSLLALDYTRYKPRGLYTGTEELQRYFRAVAWLQSIPFRSADDTELVAFLLLGRAGATGLFRERRASFFRIYDAFLGVRDEWGLRQAARLTLQRSRLDLGAEALADLRETLRERARDEGLSRINDQLRLPPGQDAETELPVFRVLPAYRTPSALLFEQTTGLGERPWPSGLEVAACLGSARARDLLKEREGAGLLQTLTAGAEAFEGEGLLFAYLHALRALVDAPEPDAPAFLHGEAWQTKSCGTLLAGWAQMRHAWTLQAKQNVLYSCCYLGRPAGFVEPEPEFFRRLAALTDRTRALLVAGGAFAPRYAPLLTALEKLLPLLEDVDTEEEYKELHRRVLREVAPPMLAFKLLSLRPPGTPARPDRTPAEILAEKRRYLRALQADLRAERAAERPELAELAADYGHDLAPLWERLTALARRLETLAHKQLRGAAFSEEENRFLQNYGEELAGIMLYGGNSYATPRDDAPRVVDVFTNPNAAAALLHVGVARPRRLYVLYPWQGRDVLCTGAVLPYYEFRHARRLTDAEWRALLDGPNRPPAPGWLAPLLDGAALQPPRFEE
jgi:hypothetical protein